MKMSNGEKYEQLFVWGSIAYWLILRLIYLYSIVNGYYLIGQLIWGCIVGVIIKKTELDEDEKKCLYNKFFGIGSFILGIVVVVFGIYEHFVLGIPRDQEPYNWGDRF